VVLIEVLVTPQVEVLNMKESEEKATSLLTLKQELMNLWISDNII